MATRTKTEPFQLLDSLMAAYATNNRINIYLINHLPEEAWTRRTPGGKGRDAKSIFAHMHNVRLLWLKSVGVSEDGIPAKVDGEDLTRTTAVSALEESYGAMSRILRQALDSDGKVKGFRPDAGSFLAYLIAHDAHHRGQVSMLARQVGYPLPQSAMFGLWEWGTR